MGPEEELKALPPAGNPARFALITGNDQIVINETTERVSIPYSTAGAVDET